MFFRKRQATNSWFGTPPLRRTAPAVARLRRAAACIAASAALSTPAAAGRAVDRAGVGAGRPASPGFRDDPAAEWTRIVDAWANVEHLVRAEGEPTLASCREAHALYYLKAPFLLRGDSLVTSVQRAVASALARTGSRSTASRRPPSTTAPWIFSAPRPTTAATRRQRGERLVPLPPAKRSGALRCRLQRRRAHGHAHPTTRDLVFGEPRSRRRAPIWCLRTPTEAPSAAGLLPLSRKARGRARCTAYAQSTETAGRRLRRRTCPSRQQ